MKRTNSFVLFARAFKNAKKDFWVSIQVLLVTTFVLAIIFYWVENEAQPEEYSNPWDAFVWAITRYIGDPGHFAGNGPITLTGRFIDTVIGLLKILVFAVPAGLVSNGFRKAMEDDKRIQKLTEYCEKMMKAFVRKQDRFTRYKIVPRYVSVTDIQVKQRMDTKDILDTIDFGSYFRLRNLASTQNISEHPQDRLVVETFPLTESTSYGCKINRNSNVTIVSTSSVSEAGIGHFSYYLALFGGFNYISKEIEPDPENPVSYYLIDESHVNEPQKDFLKDLEYMAQGEDKWTIFLLSASGAEEPLHPTVFHYIHKVQRKLECQSTTIIAEDKFQVLYDSLSSLMLNEFKLKSDLDEFYLPVGRKNISMKIGGGVKTNAFTLRIAYSITIWDERHIAIIRKMAETIKGQLEPNVAWAEDKLWKESGIGFDYN